MTVVRWVCVDAAGVPAGDGWLHPAERAVAAALARPRRRDDWRLGRFAAKVLLASVLDTDPARISVLAAADGAPDAYVDAQPAPVSVSITHRAGRAVAAAAWLPARVGCDLELVEPRSDAFVATWLAASEQRAVEALGEPARSVAVNAVWTAKEAALKVVREGLRVDPRSVAVDPVGGALGGGWLPGHVTLAGPAAVFEVCTRRLDGFVLSMCADPGPVEPGEQVDSGP